MLGRTFVVVWEGVDGAGKTTLMREVGMLVAERGYSVESYKTPSDTETGRVAKSLGNSPSIDALTRMLLFLANTSHDSASMREIVSSKNPSFLFIDRYFLCSVVYGLALLERTQKRTFNPNHFRLVFETIQELGRGIFIEPDKYVIVVLEDEDSRVKRILTKAPSEERRYELDRELQSLVAKHYRFFTEIWGEKVYWVENSDNRLYENAHALAEYLIKARNSRLAEG